MRIVASLTTMANRHASIEPVLRRLCEEQSLAPQCVYIHLPSSSKPGYRPEVVARWQTRFPTLRVCVWPEDSGPIMKLWPTLLLERDPNTLIFTADDDVLYDCNAIRTLYTS